MSLIPEIKKLIIDNIYFPDPWTFMDENKYFKDMFGDENEIKNIIKQAITLKSKNYFLEKHEIELVGNYIQFNQFMRSFTLPNMFNICNTIYDISELTGKNKEFIDILIRDFIGDNSRYVFKMCNTINKTYDSVRLYIGTVKGSYIFEVADIGCNPCHHREVKWVNWKDYVNDVKNKEPQNKELTT